MTSDTKPRQRAPGAGRKPLPECEKKRRIELWVNPALAAYYEAEDQPEGKERNRIARRRKQAAAKLLAESQIQSRIL